MEQGKCGVRADDAFVSNGQTLVVQSFRSTIKGVLGACDVLLYSLPSSLSSLSFMCWFRQMYTQL